MIEQTQACYYCGKIFTYRLYGTRKPRKFCSHKCYATDKRILSENQCKEIISMYLDSISTIRIGKEFGVAHTTIKDVLIRSKIEIGGRERYRKFTLDEQKFDQIDDEYKVYWLGFIYADGYVRQDGLSIKLKESDKKHLEKIKNWMASNTNILHDSSDHGNTVKVAFNSHHLADRLNELGIIPYRPFFHKCSNAIPSSLTLHFIRGLIDGDGYISKKESTTPNVGFAGQEDTVRWMKKTLIDNCKLKGNPQVRARTQNSYEVAFGGIFQTKKILSFIYNNANIYLNRKKELADYWIKKRASRDGY